jgi:WbqC-like protein family
MRFTAILPAYLPNVSYLTQFLPCRFVLIADHVQFQKRSSITRNRISENASILSVPVIHDGYKKAIFQKEIANIENWNGKHLKTIHHKFNTAPYFDDYFPEIEILLANGSGNLSDFLMRFLIFFAQKLKIGTQLTATSQINFEGTLEDALIRFAKSKNLKTYYYMQHDREAGLLDTQKLGVEKINTETFPKLKSESLAKMNILEFLFQYGPEASFMLRDVE